MSRRHLTYVVVAFASMALAACSGSPVAPRGIGFSGSSTDIVAAPTDTTSRIGFSGSSTDVTTTPTDTTSRIGFSGSST